LNLVVLTLVVPPSTDLKFCPSLEIMNVVGNRRDIELFRQVPKVDRQECIIVLVHKLTTFLISVGGRWTDAESNLFLVPRFCKAFSMVAFPRDRVAPRCPPSLRKYYLFLQRLHRSCLTVQILDGKSVVEIVLYFSVLRFGGTKRPVWAYR